MAKARTGQVAVTLALLIPACGGIDSAEQENRTANVTAAAPAARPDSRETPAPAPPTEEQLAQAFEAPVYRIQTDVPEGVIVEPDGLHTIVRNARCEFTPGASRARCRYEEQRGYWMQGRPYAEAVERARREDWQAGEAELVYAESPGLSPGRPYWRLLSEFMRDD